MNKTKIDWATASWNPVTGCLHDCEYCYARVKARQLNKQEQQRAEARAAELQASVVIPIMIISMNDVLGVGAERAMRVVNRFVELSKDCDDASDERIRRRMKQMKIEFT